MKCSSLVLALTAGLGGIAAAQPGPPPQPPPPPVDTGGGTTPTVEPGPPEPQPAVQPQPQPQVQPQPIAREETASSPRPDTLSFALGVGYDFGLTTSLQAPNLTSFRLRLLSGLTFEPFVMISNQTTTRDNAATMTEATDKLTVFGVAAIGRLPLITHNRVDLEMLASLGFQNEKDNPDMDYNTVTTNTLGIGWGVGLAYWFSRHWQLSMSVLNPIVSYTQTKTQIGPAMTSKTGTTSIGVVFDPDVMMMIHLYN